MLRPGITPPNAITPGRIVVSRHSGSGRAAYSPARALSRKEPATDDEWVKAPPLFRVDGINGTAGLSAIVGMMRSG